MGKSNKNSSDRYEQPFPTRLRKLLEKQNKTQKALARYIGLSPQQVSYYCDGSSAPSWETMIKIADFLDVSIDYLLGRAELKTPDIDVQKICEYTGLNEAALDNLHTESKDPETPKAINAVLGAPNYSDFHGLWRAVYAALKYSAAIQGRKIFRPEEYTEIKIDDRHITNFSPPETVNYLAIDAARRFQNIMYWSTTRGEGLHPWFDGSKEIDSTP